MHALEISGPPPEQVPRKVIESGFIKRGGQLQVVIRALIIVSLTTAPKLACGLKPHTLVLDNCGTLTRVRHLLCIRRLN